MLDKVDLMAVSESNWKSVLKEQFFKVFWGFTPKQDRFAFEVGSVLLRF